MKPLKAIIIDDEPYCCETIAMLLEDSDTVSVVAQCHSAAEGIEAIYKHQPDVVFLDVEMPKMNGFEMLNQFGKVTFEIIFTTSYDEYALKAIRFSAIDYLLKPIDEDELQKAIEKVVRRSAKPIAQQLEILMQKLSKPATTMNRVALPTLEGLEMVQIDKIIYCKSDSNYTTVYFKDKKNIVVSKTLKEIEEMLQEYSFVRVHRCFLVNTNEVEKYKKGDGGFLIMSDGSHVDVSKSRKDFLLSTLQPHKR
jgi:two-component system, LytTR family, response regulator